MSELQHIQSKIYEMRQTKVMFDFDLAELYQVETRVLNQAVKRNIKRFPADFMFQLSQEEWQNLTSQFVMSNQQIRKRRTHKTREPQHTPRAYGCSYFKHKCACSRKSKCTNKYNDVKFLINQLNISYYEKSTLNYCTCRFYA